MYGISDFFDKIAIFMERTEAYRKFQKDSCITDEEFEKRIQEEAKIRKKRAAAIISRHKIGSAIAGFLPGVDYFVNKYFIKKDAVKKAGQIFGFDISDLENSLQYEKNKNEGESGNNIANNIVLELKEENEKIPRPKLDIIKEEKSEEEKDKNKAINDNKEQQKETDKKVFR
jgi:hypothetical protein